MKFHSILYGSGKVGNIVGFKGKNSQYCIRVHQPDVRNPRTEAQLIQRAKAKLVMQTLAPFAPIAKVFMTAAAGNQRTGWQELVRVNYPEAISGTYPNFELDFSKTLISKGLMELPYSPSATADGTTLSCTWADNSGLGNAKADDDIYYAAYNDSKKQLLWGVLGERADRNGTATLPTAWTGDNVDVWMMVKSKQGTCSNSTHLATLPL